MTSLLRQLADDQFAAAQIIAAVAHHAPDTRLPVSAVAQVLALSEDEIHTLYDSHMTARDVVNWVRTGEASHLLTFIYDEGTKGNG
ncbi:hypothetical protein [Streptomyces sp. WG-D5]